MDPEYKPRPLKTSEVQLDPDLQANVEAIAQNIHEVWAQARQDGGWKYGPERNDELKEHPSMISYEALSESEKEIDRGTVEQTLKTAVKLGFEVRRRDPAKSASQETKRLHEIDDMGQWPPWPEGVDVDVLAELVKAREAIGRAYAAANKSAQHNLTAHRWFAPFVTVFGSYAVMLAILQLYGWQLFSARLEVAFAGAALLVVVVGVFFKFMRKWLVRRHRAELCRFLKFNFLLEIASAGRDRERLLRGATKFGNNAEEIVDLEYPEMEEWLEEDQVLQNPPEAAENAVALADMLVLGEHYVRTRLAIQSRYFSRQASRDMQRNVRFQNIPAMFFVASVGFAVSHFVVEWVAHRYGESVVARYEGVSRFLILLAAIFPVVGAAVRAIRGISEYSRNTSRFQAKHNALKSLIADLESRMSKQPNVIEVQNLLWKGEQILEGEHREWLRLMMEAEWIG
jgi:hypothetical protein